MDSQANLRNITDGEVLHRFPVPTQDQQSTRILVQEGDDTAGAQEKGLLQAVIE
jgi:hypothetical protein